MAIDREGLIKMLDTDITESNEARQTIIESDHRYRDLFENMTSGVVVYAAKKDGKTFIIEDFNKAAERITGLKRDLVVGKDAEMIFPGIKEAGLKDAFQRVWKTGKKTHHPVSLYQDERLSLWVENNIYKLPAGHVVAIFDDITERIQVEQKLRDSQQNLDAIMKTVPDIIYRLDTEGNITFVNNAVKKYGYTPDELLGKNVLELVHPDDLNTAVSRLNARRSGKHNVTNLKIRLLKKDTRTDQIESKPSGINPCFLLTSEELYEFNGSDNKIFTGTQGIARDITEQTQAEKEREKLKGQLLKTQKMEAIGTLAGGIAHDFNNILGGIIGYAQLLPLVIPENKRAQVYIEQILMASDRAKSLVQQILAFSRQSKTEQIPVDIGIIIKEALKLLRASLPANIEIRQNVTSNLGTIMADQTQIHQVVMNLCSNASRAMENKGGLLEVTMIPVEFNADEASASHDIEPGRYLKLTVTDSGCGMEAFTVEHIFDPYFTTKKAGEGTGLGLATVHGIVKDHGGAIRVYSEPGVGTAFHIFFPCVEVEADNEAKISEPIPSGTEDILFVDDEKFLVDSGEQVLKKLGYQVVGRTSPFEALEAFRANPDKFDIVITDMTMPQMSGENLSKEILKIRSDIPIILCTGFSKLISPEKAKAMGIKDFLMKPLTMQELAKSIRSVLDQN